MKEEKGLKKTSTIMRFEYVEGSLDDKTRELVFLAASAAVGCSH